MRPGLLTILSVFALMCVPALGEEYDIGYWLTKGFADYLNGSYEDALSSFDNAINIDQHNATAWFGKGVALSNLERYEEAVVCYDRSLQIDNQSADAWLFRGKTLGALGRYDDALQSFQEAIYIDPNNRQSWNGKAMALRSLGRIEEAEQAWTTYRDLTYAHINFSDNGGESMEDAIIITNAVEDLEGVGSEYYYLEKRFGSMGVDWDLIGQTLVSDEAGRSYDKMDIQFFTGDNKTIYFDITDFFGKDIEQLIEE